MLITGTNIAKCWIRYADMGEDIIKEIDVGMANGERRKSLSNVKTGSKLHVQ